LMAAAYNLQQQQGLSPDEIADELAIDPAGRPDRRREYVQALITGHITGASSVEIQGRFEGEYTRWQQHVTRR